MCTWDYNDLAGASTAVPRRMGWYGGHNQLPNGQQKLDWLYTLLRTQLS